MQMHSIGHPHFKFNSLFYALFCIFASTLQFSKGPANVAQSFLLHGLRAPQCRDCCFSFRQVSYPPPTRSHHDDDDDDDEAVLLQLHCENSVNRRKMQLQFSNKKLLNSSRKITAYLFSTLSTLKLYHTL